MAAGVRDMFAAVLLGVALGGGALADEMLDDPTRPAFDMVPGLGGQGVDAAPVAAAPRGLQSVILSTRREAAIIDGTEVEVGQRYGDAVLTVVNETCVVLMGPQGRRVMHMYPTVNMSKTELACVGRIGLPTTLDKVAVKPAVKKKTERKKTARKKAVTCVDDKNKNGSER